jgi:hypothetical protein
MSKRDQEGPSDDGIVAEDITQLMEHVELTGERRLIDGPEWERARPADDLEDAPIFVSEDSQLIPDLEAVDPGEDLELFTETEIDLNRRLLQVEDEQLKLAAGIGAERARWQKRVANLRADMTERNRLLAVREQEIEDLSAQFATMAVERDTFLEELRELQRSVGQDEVLEGERAPAPAEAVIASLHERLSERSRALLEAREEIDRLRVEREQLLADIAEREEFIESLHVRLRELESGEQGVGELRKLVRRFFGVEQKAQAAPVVAAQPVAEPEVEVELHVEAPAETMAASPSDATAELLAAMPPATQTVEVPIMDMADFGAPIVEDMAPQVAARAEPRVRRYLIGLDSVGSVYEVTVPRINIGRTRDNDLRIVDPTVSRLHAVLHVRGRDVTVIDANSRNGIYVNGIQLRYAKLDDGDTLTFGTVRFRYRIGSGSSASSGGEYGPD